jgi:hypothetical protein
MSVLFLAEGTKWLLKLGGVKPGGKMAADGWAEKMEDEFEFVGLGQAVVIAKLIFEI